MTNKKVNQYFKTVATKSENNFRGLFLSQTDVYMDGAESTYAQRTLILIK